MSYIGQRFKRVEDPTLLVGQGCFVDDLKLPKMLYSHIVRSPHAHARIRSIDVSAALKAPGVATVLTGEEIAQVVESMPTSFRGLGLGWEMNHPKQPLLARGVVCYVGQQVAVVVAEDPYLARDAAELVTVDYEVLPVIIEPLEALNDDSAPIHEDLGTNMGLRIFREGGDVDAAISNADRVLRGHYEVQRISPAPVETRGIVASYDEDEGLLTVWDSTQKPHELKKYLVQLLQRPESGVRVIAADVGGSFGEKGDISVEEVMIPYLALKLGRPVKWIEDRQENMLALHGRGHAVDVETGIKNDGTILGMRVHILADLGAYFHFSTPSVPALASSRMPGAYRTPAMSVEVRGAITNKVCTAVYRGAGGPESAFCMERTVELIAEELDLDPAEVRVRNFIQPTDFPYTTPTGLTYDSGEYEKGLARTLAAAGYDARRKRVRDSGSGEPLTGVGLATVVKATGGTDRVEGVRISIEPSGRITVYSGLSPHGQGTATMFVQITATELGVDPSEIRVVHGDTALFPRGIGTSASRGAVVGSTGVYTVLQEVREKLARAAADSLECAADDITFQNGSVFGRNNSERALPFGEVVSIASGGSDTGLDFSDDVDVPGGTPFSFGAHIVVVEVDRDTGEVSLLRYVALHDCGRLINPMLVDGQMHGGIVQGIGQALFEGLRYSPDGQPLMVSLMDYALPVAEDVPNLELDAMETLSPYTPLEVKGAAELSIVAAPAAVTNAVLDALSTAGVRQLDTPLTSEKIWQALRDQRG